MPTIRLRIDQIEHLRRSDPQKEIRLAVDRWRSGEIVVGMDNKRNYGANLPQLGIWKRPVGLTDSQIRAILDAHFASPVDHSRKIAQLNEKISTLMPKGEYILEEW